MKIISEAFAAEKAQKCKDMQKQLYEDMIEQESKRERYQQMLKAQRM